jgi:hypothetical protein
MLGLLTLNPTNAISIFIAPAVHAEPDWVPFQGDVWSSKYWGPHSEKNAAGLTPMHASGGALEKLDSLVGKLRGQPGFSQSSAADIANYSLSHSPASIHPDLGHCRELAVAGLVKPRPPFGENRNISGIFFTPEDMAGLLIATQIGEPYQAHTGDPNATATRLLDFVRTGGRTRLIIESPKMWFRSVVAVSRDGQYVLGENFGTRKTFEKGAIVASQAVRVPGQGLSPAQQQHLEQYRVKGLDSPVIDLVCYDMPLR